MLACLAASLHVSIDIRLQGESLQTTHWGWPSKYSP